MKKLLSLMLQLLVLLPLAAVLLPQAMSAEESGEDVVEFVLHKRMIRDIDYNDQFEYHENDGSHGLQDRSGGYDQCDPARQGYTDKSDHRQKRQKSESPYF